MSAEAIFQKGAAEHPRGTLHNWMNRGSEPCIMAYVLIATEGGKTTGW
jgi:hypothetical protein